MEPDLLTASYSLYYSGQLSIIANGVGLRLRPEGELSTLAYGEFGQVTCDSWAQAGVGTCLLMASSTSALYLQNSVKSSAEWCTVVKSSEE